jgi:hypothetical protein
MGVTLSKGNVEDSNMADVTKAVVKQRLTGLKKRFFIDVRKNYSFDVTNDI